MKNMAYPTACTIIPKTSIALARHSKKCSILSFIKFSYKLCPLKKRLVYHKCFIVPKTFTAFGTTLYIIRLGIRTTFQDILVYRFKKTAFHSIALQRTILRQCASPQPFLVLSVCRHIAPICRVPLRMCLL